MPYNLLKWTTRTANVFYYVKIDRPSLLDRLRLPDILNLTKIRVTISHWHFNGVTDL